MNKTCTICKRELLLGEFNRKAKSGDGLQNVCRECNKERSKRYYRENHRKHLAVIKRNKKKYKDRNRAIVDLVKIANGCAFCEEKELCCIDFHHMDGEKNFNISEAVCGYKTNVDTIYAEMELCACLCRNCHAKVHAGLLVVKEKHRCKFDRLLTGV